MTRVTRDGVPQFTRSVSSLAALGAEFGIAPTVDPGPDSPTGDTSADTASGATIASATPAYTGDAAGSNGHRPDPVSLLARVRSLGTALAARHERDREERAAALRELAGHDALAEEIRALGTAQQDAVALRAGFEGALATPFDDPAWIYDQALRDDYAGAVAEARATERAFAALIEGKRREVERLAARAPLARLLAERRRHEDEARTKENAAEANRQRSLVLASAVRLRDGGSLQEARRVLGAVYTEFPGDPETRSILASIDRTERTVKDTAATMLLAEARRLRRADPDGATSLLAQIDTATLSAERMREIAGVAADIARHRDLISPRFLRGQAPNSLAIIAEQCGRWEVAVAIGQDPALQPGNVITPHLATAARPLHRRR